MKRILLFSLLLLALLGRSTPAQAQLPGPCAGTVYPFLQICTPPSGQNPWIKEWEDFALKVDTHAGNTATPHGAVTTATANKLPLRDGSGNLAGNILGNSATASAFQTNPADCATNEFAFGIQVNGALSCLPLSAANVSGVLALTAGSGQPLTDAIYLDNLGIRGAASDTQMACTSGVYWITPDLSEAKWKKCDNGVLSDIGAGAGASGDITSVWTAATGDVNGLIASGADFFDAGAASSSRPCTRSAILPATCNEGQCHQKTDAGGSETHICTQTNTWVKLATTTDTAPLATALAAIPSLCGTGNAPLGVLTNGNATGCTDYATQIELNTHANDMTTAHGATTANTPNRIPLRDALGGVRVKFTRDTLATLPVCDATSAHTQTVFVEGINSQDCGQTGGGTTENTCYCNGAEWGLTTSSASAQSLQAVYDFSEPIPTIFSGADGLRFKDFNSFTKSVRICGVGTNAQCHYEYIDDSGRYVETFKYPIPMLIKLFPALPWGILDSAESTLLQVSEAGQVSGIAQFLEKCQPYNSVASTTDNKLLASFQQPVTIKSVWCSYEGAAPTTPAQFTFEHGSGTALTHTIPTCAAPSAIATPQTVTANGSFAAYETLRFDTTNTPNPATDTYLVCAAYVLDSAVSVNPGLITLASDSFTRADSGDLGTSWDVVTGEAAFKILSNVSLPGSGFGSDSAESYNAVAFPDDQWAQAAISLTAGGEGIDEGMGVLLRASPSARTYYAFVVHKGASNNVGIYKNVASVYTHLATATTTWVDGDILRAEVEGSTLRVYKNDAQLGADVTDTSITTGRAGIKYSSSITGASLDDWSAGRF